MRRRAWAILLVPPKLLGAWLLSRSVIGALLIRFVFDLDAAKTKRAMERHAAQGIKVERGIAYAGASDGSRGRGGGRDALLDVYRRVDHQGPQPTIVWVHGGAWLSGHRDDAAPYFTLLADAGYTVVSVGYSRSPAAHYPTPVGQVAEALDYLARHAAELGVDPDRIALGGDSAGAQIVSQLAAMIADADFATEVGIRVDLPLESLRAVVLHCGIYDMRRFLNLDGVPSRLLRWGVRETVRAYTGSLDTGSRPARQMSTIDHLTPDFPPAFISGGNGDRLTDTQSRPLAAALTTKDVEVTTLFFEADQTPALPHEYQFNLDTEAGQEALRQTLAFLGRHLVSESEASE